MYMELPALVLLDCLTRAKQLPLSGDTVQDNKTLSMVELLYYFHRDLHTAYQAAKDADVWCNLIWVEYLVRQQIPAEMVLMFKLCYESYEINWAMAQARQRLLCEQFGLVVKTGISA